MDENWTVIEESFTVTGTVATVGDENPQNNSCSVYFPGCTNCGDYEDIGGLAINASTNQLVDFDPLIGSMVDVSSYSTDPFPMAAEYDECWLYVVHDDFSYVKIDGDGTSVPLGNITGATGTPTGLAYNHQSETMYLLTLDDSNVANLYTLNSLMANYVGSGTDQMIIAMDFADDGMLYGPAIADDQLYQINPADGSTIAMGPVGIDLNFGQDVSWFLGALYTFTSGEVNAYGVYNVENGEFVQISNPIADQIAAMNVFEYGCPYYEVNYGIYGEPQGSIDAFADGFPFASGEEFHIMTQIKFEAAPNSGWSVANWWLNGQATGETGNSFMIESLEEDVEVLVEFAVSIDEAEFEDIRIYPNPTNGILNIEFSNKARLEILNASGKIVYTNDIEGKSTINLTGQLPGIYFVKLISDDKSYVRKITLK